MSDQRHLSPFQFTQHPDGSPRLVDFPGLTLTTVEGQGSATGRGWETELGLPTYFEEWDALARIRSEEHRGELKFVLMDESKTRLSGHPRLHPKQIVFPTMCPLELGHQGFLIGLVYGYLFGGFEANHLEGDYVIGLAHFFDSALAEKALEGVQRGILSHACPVIWTPPSGSEQLVQVSLVPGDFPGCPNARILNCST